MVVASLGYWLSAVAQLAADGRTAAGASRSLRQYSLSTFRKLARDIPAPETAISRSISREFALFTEHFSSL